MRREKYEYMKIENMRRIKMIREEKTRRER